MRMRSRRRRKEREEGRGGAGGNALFLIATPIGNARGTDRLSEGVQTPKFTSYTLRREANERADGAIERRRRRKRKRRKRRKERKVYVLDCWKGRA